MKITAFTFVLIFIYNIAYSQVGGNELYEQNNRYIQNANYDAGTDQIWKKRGYNRSLRVDTRNSDKEMIFTVNALLNQKADSYLAIFSVVQAGKTIKEVNDLANARINKFKERIKKNGITEKDIYIDMVSSVPVYGYNVEKRLFSSTYTEVPKGFEIQKNIHVKYKDVAVFDKIMNAAANSEIYDLIKVEYFVNDSESNYTKLREKAIDYMNKKLLSFKKLNINFDKIYHIISEKSAVVYPVDRYKSYQAFTGSTIPSGSGKTVKSIRKPKTMFYNKLPYHKFDIVINPTMLEPSIQFTYSLTAKYIIKEEKEKPKTQYIWLTPDGNIKNINPK